MCLVAEQFPDDVVRSKVMGIVLGSMAVGVLVGYPFGSLLYDFVGKMAPFIVISVAVLLNGGMFYNLSVCVFVCVRACVHVEDCMWSPLWYTDCTEAFFTLRVSHDFTVHAQMLFYLLP